MYAAFPRSEYRMGESDFHHRLDLPQKGFLSVGLLGPHMRAETVMDLPGS
jgi:hypothetical protein